MGPSSTPPASSRKAGSGPQKRIDLHQGRFLEGLRAAAARELRGLRHVRDVAPATLARLRRLRLPDGLYPYQLRIVASRAKQTIVVSATQIGKTVAGCFWLIAQAWMRPGSLWWWVAPTFHQADVGFDRLLTFVQSAAVYANHHRTKRRIWLINGSLIECRSWEREETLGGPSIHGAVVDEGEHLTISARAKISARRSATLGPLMFLGNASYGLSELWRIWKQAKADTTGRMRAISLTWKDRAEVLPPLERAEYEAFIADEANDLPREEHDRLYNAKFLEMGTGVADIRSICTAGGSELHPVRMPFDEPWDREVDGACVGGMDLGEQESYTVLSIWGKKSGRLKSAHRFRHVAWEVQAARVAKICAPYCDAGNPETYEGRVPLTLFSDLTGIGRPVAETMRRHCGPIGVSYRGRTFTNSEKADMVASVQLATEKETGDVLSMPWLEVFVSEADTLERTKLSSSVRYAASKGFKDDAFWSLALAVHGMRKMQKGLPLI